MSLRHLSGLAIFAVLCLVLFWFWQQGLGLVQMQLRTWPALRAIWTEFGLLIVLLVTLLLLGGAQLAWDKIPSPGDDGDGDRDDGAANVK